jgi:hypothetical protein
MDISIDNMDDLICIYNYLSRNEIIDDNIYENKTDSIKHEIDNLIIDIILYKN